MMEQITGADGADNGADIFSRNAVFAMTEQMVQIIF